MNRRLPPPLPPPELSESSRAIDQDRLVDRALDDGGTAVAVLRLDGTIRQLNGRMLELLGVSMPTDVAAGSAAAGVLRSFLDQLPSDVFSGRPMTWNGIIDHRELSGRQSSLRATASVDPTSGPDDIALVLHDITDAEAERAELIHRAAHDPLTGLPTRSTALAHLTRLLGARSGRHAQVAAVLVDIDNFGRINDVFGQRAGDRLLVACTRRLVDALHPGHDIARVGGDEFLVVADGTIDAIDATELAERARRALTGRLRVGDIDVNVSVSVGIAGVDPDLDDARADDAAAQLIRHAETAVAVAKADGGSRCAVFSPRTRASAKSRAELAVALTRGIAIDELEVEYQPIHSAVTGAVVGAEALVRWSHPTDGPIDPTRLIAVAEEAGSIVRLGELVIDRALADFAGWQDDGRVHEGFVLHVNVSRLQLRSATYVDFVAARLSAHGIEPNRLVLEARETPLLSSQSGVAGTIRALRGLGVRLAIDDFGTGARSLAVLTDVGVDILKLDGSLTLPSGSSLAEVRVVRAVIALAHALDIDVVAERVSDPEQLDQLRAAGCDMLQGNLLGAPVPADDARFDPAAGW